MCLGLLSIQQCQILRQSKSLKAISDETVSSRNPIPERLKEARTRAGMSQRALGLFIGFDPSSASSRMNHYEKGRHVPDIDALRRMAVALDVPLNYFFCDDQTTAELALLISKMTESERRALIDSINISGNRKVADCNDKS